MNLPAYNDFDDTLLVESFRDSQAEVFDDCPTDALMEMQSANTLVSLLHRGKDFTQAETQNEIRKAQLALFREFAGDIFANPENAAEICNQLRERFLEGV